MSEVQGWIVFALIVVADLCAVAYDEKVSGLCGGFSSAVLTFEVLWRGALSGAPQDRWSSLPRFARLRLRPKRLHLVEARLFEGAAAVS